ncbi:MAG: MBL fold metallo-hydrolase [Candidatus Omnitrophica bacterium]|nr:MBL fold metallo-hydrolase [Candidatus Omnitrophota bacterium]MCF7892385.1 MBL fold metallo-hydrolase [Candidatus Omnitrophota bacterium]MCF7895954.1 MBL fold metallo-hydrolase [Candidatus Omnitrophota bacterium]MCF7898067.1 MBL fold metallo-hydrolase [Candidatus Omnitrophota bacterium]MCF7909919.1 MBL fold metallo-hydrolase [Candidatus Omnitrophota bacterium]
MNLIIHRGTKEIGGSCVELKSAKTRIIIDLGIPLVDIKDKTKKFNSFSLRKKTASQLLASGVLPTVKGLYEGVDDGKSVDAFFLSHPHQDHYGFCQFIRKDIPVFLSRDAGRMLKAADVFLPVQFGKHKQFFLKNHDSVDVGNMKITPYLMDHSGYGAMAFLVETEGKKIFYSGDFRGHGRKKDLFEKFLKSPPLGVNVLIMEGTMVDRAEESVDSEEQLETKIVKEARSYPGAKFIFCSGQNVDRLVTFYRSARRLKALFVLDLYTANILHELMRKSMPVPSNGFKDVGILFTKHFMKRLEQKKMPDWYKRWRRYEISPASLRRKGGNLFVVYRERSQPELEAAGIRPGSVLFYSQWGGYMEEPSFKPTETFCQRHNMDIRQAHTSGHATIRSLKRLGAALNPQVIVPIHSFAANKFHELFDNVRELDDKEVFKL